MDSPLALELRDPNEHCREPQQPTTDPQLPKKEREQCCSARGNYGDQNHTDRTTNICTASLSRIQCTVGRVAQLDNPHTAVIAVLLSLPSDGPSSSASIGGHAPITPNAAPVAHMADHAVKRHPTAAPCMKFVATTP